MKANICNVKNCSYLQKSEPHFLKSHAEKQTEGAKYELSRQYHITVWSGEIQRSGLAVQITLLLFNTHRMWFHLPVTTYKWGVDSQFLPITAVSALGRASTLCYFKYEILLNMSQDFISLPQCSGASMWQGGVTTCLYRKKNGLLSTQLFLQSTLCWKSRNL